LLQNRRNAAVEKPAYWERLGYRIFGIIANDPFFWSLTKKLGRLGQPLHRLVKGATLDPAGAWTRTRDLPPLARVSFKEWWRNRS
jgi:L-lactate dehydrogenase complex protein LldF